VSPKVLTKTYTAGARVIPVGEVTLPLYDVPDDNTTTSYTVRVQVTGADRYSEVMLLDTAGRRSHRLRPRRRRGRLRR
jgi:hypothetical protein